MTCDHYNSKVSTGNKEIGSVPDFADDSPNAPGLVLLLFTSTAFICEMSIINNQPCLCTSLKEYCDAE